MKAFNAANSLFWLKAGDYQVMNKARSADDTNSLVYLYKERLEWSAATTVTITNNLPQ